MPYAAYSPRTGCAALLIIAAFLTIPVGIGAIIGWLIARALCE